MLCIIADYGLICAPLFNLIRETLSHAYLCVIVSIRKPSCMECLREDVKSDYRKVGGDEWWE